MTTPTPADNLRIRIAEALAAHDGLTWGPGRSSQPSGVIEDYHRRADAVLAALPETAVARQVLGTPTTDTAPETVLEPQDHPGADLFVALQAAGLDADEANRRMYAYAAMVLRQEKAITSAPAAPADRAILAAGIRAAADEIAGIDFHPNARARSLDIATGLVHRLRRLADEAQPAETEACRPIDVDGGTVLVRGGGDLTDEEQGYLADIVRAARHRYEAEHATTAATEEPQP